MILTDTLRLKHNAVLFLINMPRKSNSQSDNRLYLIIGALSLMACAGYFLIQEQTINRLELFFVQLQSSNAKGVKQPDTSISFSPYIAHAGGAINGLEYTNSLEAVQKSYNDGFRLIEVDLFLTSDNQLVLLHQTPKVLEDLYENLPQKITLENFKKMHYKSGLTPLTFEELIQFMEKHRDLNIIAHPRGEYEIYKIIAEKYPHYQNRIIPQIYYFFEYYPVLKLGYKKIILTLYENDYSDEILRKFLSHHKVNILTVPLKRISQGFIDKFKNTGVKIYTHPVNQISLKNQLFKMGVDGIYTSSLPPY